MTDTNKFCKLVIIQGGGVLAEQNILGRDSSKRFALANFRTKKEGRSTTARRGKAFCLFALENCQPFVQIVIGSHATDTLQEMTRAYCVSRPFTVDRAVQRQAVQVCMQFIFFKSSVPCCMQRPCTPAVRYSFSGFVGPQTIAIELGNYCRKLRKLLQG